jgi:hypothetical protein
MFRGFEVLQRGSSICMGIQTIASAAKLKNATTKKTESVAKAFITKLLAEISHVTAESLE